MTTISLPRAIHLDLIQIQSTPYASSNRDRNGSPKSAVYGGVLRGRESAQHQKFHSRGTMQNILGEKTFRTRATTLAATRHLTDRGWDKDEALTAVQMLILGSQIKGLGIADNGATNVLLFLPETAISELVDLIDQHRDDFAPYITQAHADLDKEAKKKAKAKTATNAPAADTDDDGEPAEDTNRTAIITTHAKKITDTKNGFLPKERILGLLRTRNAVIAAYGRMLANEPGSIVEASIQTAHALSTHAITTQIDSFTAVDDILNELGDESGAGHLGEQRYNSATFYRYSTLNITKLIGNLDGDHATARDVIEAFLHAATAHRNVGKVSGTAPHTLPHLLYAAVRTDRPVNLAGAFEEPVPATATGGYLTASLTRLDAHAGAHHRFLGTNRIAGHTHVTLADQDLTHLGDRADSFDEFVTTTLATIDKARG
ncbi:type I-E CRISPR-associated protein Cas7/Cse4/CasC [Streptomyces sp. NPDC004667]|uniref:type I-E CRISPR-associated protein Cas7/Cse4/CasC n=1 Tax=Streptomyces sp. NPDC004667 TaxID=3154285 RepID=UPI0033A4E6E7